MNRYSRQTNFPPLGTDGQRRLQRGRVLIVGCGALGGTVVDLLVRAGVGRDGGTVSVLDPDVVQLSNLQRQTLFTEQDCGRLKVESARSALLAVDSKANVEALAERFTEHNADMVEKFDLLIDATDNFPTRFLLNRFAMRFRKPFISAGVAGASGQMMVVIPGVSACLECFLDGTHTDSAPPVAVLGPLPQLFAALEAVEAIKILTGQLDAVSRSLVAIDLWSNSFRRFEIPRNADCPVCGSDPKN